jgi:hypothetical protein
MQSIAHYAKIKTMYESVDHILTMAIPNIATRHCAAADGYKPVKLHGAARQRRNALG